jgi:hypothetical protein
MNESDLNKNPFWLALWKLANEEFLRHGDSSIPIGDQIIAAFENLAQRIEPTADWYQVKGVETPAPLPADPPLNCFVFGCMLGNFLAWSRGVTFFHPLKLKN